MIMAAGVTPDTVKEIIVKAGVDEVHSAAATSRKSNITYIKSDAKMGHGDDFFLNVVDGELVKALKQISQVCDLKANGLTKLHDPQKSHSPTNQAT